MSSARSSAQQEAGEATRRENEESEKLLSLSEQREVDRGQHQSQAKIKVVGINAT